MHASQVATDHTGRGSLSDMLGFDTLPLRVHDDGTVSEAPGAYSPECSMDQSSFSAPYVGDGWELISGGYTGQYGYAGPVMHASETLTGPLAEHILATPGVYAAVVVEGDTSDDDDSGDMRDDVEPAGWAVARQKDANA